MHTEKLPNKEKYNFIVQWIRHTEYLYTNYSALFQTKHSISLYYATIILIIYFKEKCACTHLHYLWFGFHVLIKHYGKCWFLNDEKLIINPNFNLAIRSMIDNKIPLTCEIEHFVIFMLLFFASIQSRDGGY